METRTDMTEATRTEVLGMSIALLFLERSGYQGVRERGIGDGLGIEAWEGSTLVLVALRCVAAEGPGARPPLDVSGGQAAGWRAAALRAAADGPGGEAVRVDVLSPAVTGESRASLRHLSGVVSCVFANVNVDTRGGTGFPYVPSYAAIPRVSLNRSGLMPPSERLILCALCRSM